MAAHASQQVWYRRLFTVFSQASSDTPKGSHREDVDRPSSQAIYINTYQAIDFVDGE